MALNTFEQLRIIDDADFDVYERAIMVHIWRVGHSWESIKTLASKTKMSVGKASSTRAKLISDGWLIETKKEGQNCISINLKNAQKSTKNDDTTKTKQAPHEPQQAPHEPQQAPHETKITSLSKPNKIECEVDDENTGNNEIESCLPSSLENNEQDKEIIESKPMPIDANHPAIKAIRHVQKSYPNKKLWGTYARALGENPDLEVLIHVSDLWNLSITKDGKPYNPANVNGKLEWYELAMKSSRPLEWYFGKQNTGWTNTNEKANTDWTRS